MVQEIAAECMHNSDQSNEEGIRSLNIYDASSIEGYVLSVLFSKLSTL